MLRERSPLFRVWFVLLLGAVGPIVMGILGRPVEQFFTLDTLLEFVRVSIGGAFAALVSLFVEKPRPQHLRERALDRMDRKRE